MTTDAFRRHALSQREAQENSHFGKADFRVRNKIFASLKDEKTGVIKLTPEQQEILTAAEPAIFASLPGGWGRKGWTMVILAMADEASLASALAMAWRNVAPKSISG